MNIERKKKGKQFIYMNKGSIIKDKKILDRINKLVIPPAWKNVVIANSSKDKVQCIGVDDKNRKQYKYHSDYVKYKSDKKYYDTLIQFGKKINTIREDILKILRKRTWDLEKTIAFVIYIIDNCHLRIGNEKYKDENNSYGITTLERRHININTTSVYFDFVGKKGVENTCVFKEKKIISLFRSLDNEFKPTQNDTFFKYYNSNGSIYNINSSHINDFLKQYGDFSAKNFRTWSANEFIIKYLYNILNNLPEEYDELSERNCSIIINKCVDNVSEKLNNTRAICKKSYICNDIFDDFKSDPFYFLKQIKSLGKSKIKNCNGLESILLKLLSKYKSS